MRQRVTLLLNYLRRCRIIIRQLLAVVIHGNYRDLILRWQKFQLRALRAFLGNIVSSIFRDVTLLFSSSKN